MKKKNSKAAKASTDAYHHRWITDRAWISGLVGATAVIIWASWYSVALVLTKGVSVWGFRITETKQDSILFALISIAIVMLLTEMVRLYIYGRRQHFFSIHPYLQNRAYFKFVYQCIWHYLLYMGLIILVVNFFHTAGEYGFQKQGHYYQVWFRFLTIVQTGFLWCGLPYIVITRAFKYDEEADKKDLAIIMDKLLRIGWGKIVGSNQYKIEEPDKKAGRALLVKLFFAPLMTVFFYDQFPYLVSNIHYLINGLPNAISRGSYSHIRFNTDFFNISVAFIFSIDVALAWCGYITSSRWVKNQTVSAEPTVTGWVVCLICYPPFQMFLTLYYAAPGERDILRISEPYLVTFFSVLMLLSYFIYMWSTLCFGVRFSNLTHRGIIRKGPYALIRHPAYASKNFAWWCVMFPAILYTASTGSINVAIAQILGLIFMTWIYYWRAITEERHLSVDPEYQMYCRHVKFRFIPGLL